MTQKPDSLAFNWWWALQPQTDQNGHIINRGNPGALEVKQAIAEAVTKIRAAGKAAGIIHYDTANFAYYRDLGVNFLGTGADVSLMRAAMQANLLAARTAVES